MPDFIFREFLKITNLYKMIKIFSNLSKCYYICPYIVVTFCTGIEAITFYFIVELYRSIIYHLVLYLVGARMIYRYLPKSVGLRRITLHKSTSQGDKMYLLICECSQLQDNLSAAAILLPALRARLCGHIGLYRPSVCF